MVRNVGWGFTTKQHISVYIVGPTHKLTNHLSRYFHEKLTVVKVVEKPLPPPNLWNPKLNYCAQKSQPLGLIPSQISPHSIPPDFFKTHITILPHMLVPTHVLFLSGFPILTTWMLFNAFDMLIRLTTRRHISENLNIFTHHRKSSPKSLLCAACNSSSSQRTSRSILA
jgi:hypothetical protein